MPGSIVCGVDGSQGSLTAVKVAARVADGLGLRLVLAHARDSSARFPYGHELHVQRRWQRAGGRVTSLFERIGHRLNGVEADRRVVNGPPARVLAVVAAEERAALVVVGSRGRGPLTAALLDSVSSAVVRASDRPVVVVPPDAAPESGPGRGDPLTVICGVDDDSEQAKDTARVAAWLAVSLGLELVLVHAYQPAPSGAAIPAPGVAPPIDQEVLEERQRAGARSLLVDLAGQIGKPQTAVRVELGDSASTLDRSAREQRAELIVVGARRRGPLASGLLGSTSARLAAGASTPVVIVPPGALRATEKAVDLEVSRR